MISHKGTCTTKTDRLLLRKFEMGDSSDMFTNWANDSEVSKFLSWRPHQNIDETKTIINRWVNAYENNNTYNWAIVLEKTESVIGSISIIEIDEKNYSCEIGYCISRIYWGQGIMSEALKAVIDFLFSEVGFNRIVGKHDTKNIASGRVMLKSGMTYEGTLRQVKIRNNTIFYDLAVYSIIKDDWLKKQL